MKEPISNKDYIASILDLNELLIKSDLTRLSNLSGEDMELLKRTWGKTDVKRRRQIMSHLVQLGETNFKLDFSNIFGFCLQDTDRKVKTLAITGLIEEENPLHIPPLIQLLKEDVSFEVRAAAAMALGKFATLGELGKLTNNSTKDLYTALSRILGDESESMEIKGLVLEAIAPLNLPEVKRFIEKAYRSSDIKFKASAIRAMGRNCDPIWLNTLINELGSDNAGIRCDSANACGEIGLDEAVPHLMKLIGNADVRTQTAAITALGEIGSEEAAEALNKLIKNPKQRIRQAAKSALEELQFCDDLPSPNF